MTSRIEQLEKFVKEDPADPFNTYALALEYTKVDKARATELFNGLIRDHSEYLPAYYHLAKLYENLEENDKALMVFDRGIELATKQNDQKTLHELMGAKQELLFES
jgi:tetratricopeptide (TPR) repeat protein